MSWPQVERLAKSTPVIIPVAAIEQHGDHLPVFTDSMLLGEIVRRAELSVGTRVVFTPLQWFGNSEHHLDFPGTMSAAPRNYLDLLRDHVESILKAGFLRIVFLNGHGGNIIPCQQAMFELRQKHRERRDLLLLSATYWQLGSKPSESIQGLFQSEMGHACEWETSMILRLRPDLVRDSRSVEPTSQQSSMSPAHRAWVTQDRTGRGHIGNPAVATADKGEALLATFSADVSRFLERVARWDGVSWE